MEKITILVPCKNEENYISACLDSIVKNDYPKDFMEVLVIDGNSNDKTIDIVKMYEEKFNFIHLINNSEETVPHALNLGIKNAVGEYIIILGAHSDIPKNYFSELVSWSKKLHADNVGPVCITDVKNKNPKTNSIKTVLSNKFGVGNSLFRIGVDKVKEVDNISFGCYKKESLYKSGLYNIHLTRNQDIELNKRLKRQGGKIFLIPSLHFKYYARETFKGIAKNNFQTGMWNILTIYITKKINSISFRHFIPMFFLLSIILPLMLTAWIPIIGIITAFSITAYLFTIVTVSFKLSSKDTTWYYIILSFIVIHFSYGFGSLIGLFKFNYLFK